jgi:hypothetical protein
MPGAAKDEAVHRRSAEGGQRPHDIIATIGGEIDMDQGAGAEGEAGVRYPVPIIGMVAVAVSWTS